MAKHSNTSSKQNSQKTDSDIVLDNVLKAIRGRRKSASSVYISSLTEIDITQKGIVCSDMIILP